MSESVEAFLEQVRSQVEEEISRLRLSLDVENEDKNEDVLMNIALAQHRYAKLLSSVGLQKDAVEYYQPAWDSAQRYIPTKNHLEQGRSISVAMEIYSRAAYGIGAEYVVVLDYLARIADCETVFNVLNKSCYFEGPHLGDYAFFLHRRKRDFDQAEK